MLSLKGIPTPEIMEKVDTVKKILIGCVYRPWDFLKIDPEYLYKIILFDVILDITDSSKEIGVFVKNLTKSIWWGYLSMYIVGYDMAYRLRIQDMLNECDHEEIVNHPQRELKRLWKIYVRRECVIGDYMIPKSRRLYWLLRIVLLLPKFKRAFQNAMRQVNWDRIAFTSEDVEWIQQRVDYRFDI